MTLDRPDTQKEIYKGMVCPTLGHWRRLQRLGRYLRGRPRVVLLFKYQVRGRAIDGYSDSNWAECRKRLGRGHNSSKSLVKVLGASQLKPSWLQESKFAKSASASCSWLTIGASNNKGVSTKTLRQRKGGAHRRGNGKVRHVRVGTLWIQELVENVEIEVKRVLGACNVADALTKNVPAMTLEAHFNAMWFQFQDGRAVSSLTIP